MSATGVVGGACVPHAPQFFTLPSTEDHDQVARIEGVLGNIGSGLRALEPDVVVVVANDHLDNFMFHCVPSFTVHCGPVAAGEFAGRSFSWPVAGALGNEVLAGLQSRGFDPAFSMEAPIGYEFGIPLTFLGFGPETPLLPVFVNSYVPPQPSADRCYAFGRALADSLASAGVRAVVIGSGGLSHYPGTDRYGSPDVATDTELLEKMKTGNLRTLLSLDDDALDRTGNVEARSWLISAGAIGERVPDEVSFEPSWHHTYVSLGWTAAEPRRLGAGEERHYPLLRADRLLLGQALYRLRKDRDACLQFLADAEGFAARYELAPDEREALVALDEAKLRELGIHPLLGFLARLEVGLARKASEASAPAAESTTP